MTVHWIWRFYATTAGSAVRQSGLPRNGAVRGLFQQQFVHLGQTLGSPGGCRLLGCHRWPHRSAYTLEWAMMLSPDAGSGVGLRVSRWPASGIPGVWRICSLPSWRSLPNRASWVRNQGRAAARGGVDCCRAPGVTPRVLHQDAALASCSNLRIFQHALCRLEPAGLRIVDGAQRALRTGGCPAMALDTRVFVQCRHGDFPSFRLG